MIYRTKKLAKIDNLNKRIQNNLQQKTDRIGIQF